MLTVWVGRKEASSAPELKSEDGEVKGESFGTRVIPVRTPSHFSYGIVYFPALPSDFTFVHVDAFLAERICHAGSVEYLASCFDSCEDASLPSSVRLSTTSSTRLTALSCNSSGPNAVPLSFPIHFCCFTGVPYSPPRKSYCNCN